MNYGISVKAIAVVIATGTLALVSSYIARPIIGPADAAAPTSMDLKISTGTYTPVGCKDDPTAPGCGLFPVPVIRILNRGDSIHIDKIVINKRSKDAHCNKTVDQTLNTGDIWMSEGTDGDAMKDELAEVTKIMSGIQPYNYAEYCGQQVIYVEVVTDRGSQEFHIK